MPGRRAARTAFLALLVLLGLAAPAVAATPRAVAGGGDFADAPLLAPGSYDDTLIAQESLYYAVRLGPGQRLRVTTHIDFSPSRRVNGDVRAAQFGTLLQAAYTPTLAQDYDATTDYRNGADETGIGQVTSTPARAVGDALGAGATPYAGAGTWYVSVTLAEFVLSTGPRVELPMRIDVAVEGPAPAAGALPGADVRGGDPLSLPGRAIEAAQLTPAARRVAGAELGASTGALVAAGVGGLLLGLLAVVGLARRGPRRRPAPG